MISALIFFFLLLFPIRSWTWLWISYGNVNFLCEVLCLRLVVRIILGLMSCRACRDEYERITKLTKYKAWIDVVQFAFSWFYIGFFRIGYVYDVSRVFWFLCTSRSWLDFNFLCFYFYSKYFSSFILAKMHLCFVQSLPFVSSKLNSSRSRGIS